MGGWTHSPGFLLTASPLSLSFWFLNNLWSNFFFSFSAASVHQQLPAGSRPHHSPADRPLLPPGTHLQTQRAHGPPCVGVAAEKSQPDLLFRLRRWWVRLWVRLLFSWSWRSIVAVVPRQIAVCSFHIHSDYNWMMVCLDNCAAQVHFRLSFSINALF